jgi:hypothetical protein
VSLRRVARTWPGETPPVSQSQSLPSTRASTRVSLPISPPRPSWQICIACSPMYTCFVHARGRSPTHTCFVHAHGRSPMHTCFVHPRGHPPFSRPASLPVLWTLAKETPSYILTLHPGSFSPACLHLTPSSSQKRYTKRHTHTHTRVPGPNIPTLNFLNLLRLHPSICVFLSSRADSEVRPLPLPESPPPT